MKKIILMLCFCSIAVQAAVMGTVDRISKTLTVRNDFWQCSFIEGSMFPSDFVFKNGKKPGIILFRDTAQSGKTVYSLHEERHSVCRILKNTANELIVEFEGGFWRNQNPVISPLKDLKVICRYEFKRDSDIVKMHIKYVKKSAENIKINDIFDMNWYYENPFDAVSIDGRKIDFKKAQKPLNPFSGKAYIVFENRDCFIKYSAANVRFLYARRGNFPISVSIKGGNLTEDNCEFSVSLQMRAK